MTRSVCIFCGARKKHPISKCNSCGRTPSTSVEESAKSIMISNLPDNNGVPFMDETDLERLSLTKGIVNSDIFDLRVLEDLIAENKGFKKNGSDIGFLVFGSLFLVIPVIAILMAIF